MGNVLSAGEYLGDDSVAETPAIRGGMRGTPHPMRGGGGGTPHPMRGGGGGTPHPHRFGGDGYDDDDDDGFDDEDEDVVGLDDGGSLQQQSLEGEESVDAPQPGPRDTPNDTPRKDVESVEGRVLDFGNIGGRDASSLSHEVGEMSMSASFDGQDPQIRGGSSDSPQVGNAARVTHTHVVVIPSVTARDKVGERQKPMKRVGIVEAHGHARAGGGEGQARGHSRTDTGIAGSKAKQTGKATESERGQVHGKGLKGSQDQRAKATSSEDGLVGGGKKTRVRPPSSSVSSSRSSGLSQSKAAASKRLPASAAAQPKLDQNPIRATCRPSSWSRADPASGGSGSKSDIDHLGGAEEGGGGHKARARVVGGAVDLAKGRGSRGGALSSKEGLQADAENRGKEEKKEETRRRRSKSAERGGGREGRRSKSPANGGKVVEVQAADARERPRGEVVKRRKKRGGISLVAPLQSSRASSRTRKEAEELRALLKELRNDPIVSNPQSASESGGEGWKRWVPGKIEWSRPSSSKVEEAKARVSKAGWALHEVKEERRSDSPSLLLMAHQPASGSPDKLRQAISRSRGTPSPSLSISDSPPRWVSPNPVVAVAPWTESRSPSPPSRSGSSRPTSPSRPISPSLPSSRYSAPRRQSSMSAGGTRKVVPVASSPYIADVVRPRSNRVDSKMRYRPPSRGGRVVMDGLGTTRISDGGMKEAGGREASPTLGFDYTGEDPVRWSKGSKGASEIRMLKQCPVFSPLWGGSIHLGTAGLPVSMMRMSVSGEATLNLKGGLGGDGGNVVVGWSVPPGQNTLQVTIVCGRGLPAVDRFLKCHAQATAELNGEMRSSHVVKGTQDPEFGCQMVFPLSAGGEEDDGELVVRMWHSDENNVVDELAGKCDTILCDSGTLLGRQGEVPDCILILASGQVASYNRSTDGHIGVVGRTSSPGASLCAADALGGVLASHSLSAATDVALVRVPVAAIASVLRRARDEGIDGMCKRLAVGALAAEQSFNGGQEEQRKLRVNIKVFRVKSLPEDVVDEGKEKDTTVLLELGGKVAHTPPAISGGSLGALPDWGGEEFAFTEVDQVSCL